MKMSKRGKEKVSSIIHHRSQSFIWHCLHSSHIICSRGIHISMGKFQIGFPKNKNYTSWVKKNGVEFLYRERKKRVPQLSIIFYPTLSSFLPQWPPTWHWIIAIEALVFKQMSYKVTYNFDTKQHIFILILSRYKNSCRDFQ